MRSILAVLFLLMPLGASSAPAPAVVSIPLPKGDVLRFIVAGDAGTGEPHLRKGIVTVARKTRIDAILLVGDNVYPCGVASIDDPQWAIVRNNFSDAKLPIYPVLGNHDYGNPSPQDKGTDIKCRPSPQAQVTQTGHLKNWIFPARQYALRSPLADIVMFDSQPVASAWPAPFLGSLTAKDELSWIRQALEESHGAWRIALGHHTIYSSGVHGIGNHANQRHMRETLLPLFREKHLDLYICGHDHDAELIGDLNDRAGDPVFLITGNGATSAAMEPRTRKGEPATDFPSFPAKPLVGFSLLEITRSEIRVTFYDGAGLRCSSTYTIRKRH